MLGKKILLMASRLADIFRHSQDLESFERAVVKLDGNFSLDQQEMIQLGEEYLKRYPDRKEDRNPEEIRLGYRLARICITEQLISGFSRQVKEQFRCAFRDIGDLGKVLETLKVGEDRDRFFIILEAMDQRIMEIHETVKTLPLGMIRERFTGALSTSSNLLYLFRMILERRISEKGTGVS